MPRIGRMRKLGQLKGTARPVGAMRAILGRPTQQQIIDEWREWHAYETNNRLKELVNNGVISKRQFQAVSKAIASGLHEQPKRPQK